MRFSRCASSLYSRAFSTELATCGANRVSIRTWSSVNQAKWSLSRSITPTTRSCATSGTATSERTPSCEGMYRGSASVLSERTTSRESTAAPVMPRPSGMLSRSTRWS